MQTSLSTDGSGKDPAQGETAMGRCEGIFDMRTATVKQIEGLLLSGMLEQKGQCFLSSSNDSFHHLW